MKKLIAVGCLMLVLCFLSFSQIRDAAFWGYVEAEKKLAKKTYFHFKTQSRFNENFSRYDFSFYDAGLDYSINRFFNLTGAYVFNINRTLENSIIGRHQFYGNFTLNYETYNFKFMNRNRIQSNIDEENFLDAYRQNNIDFFYRNRSTVRYFLSKKIHPYASFEIYYRLNNFRQWENYNYRTRSYAGFFYRLGKNQKLEFYYMLQRQLRRKQLHEIYVLGIGFSQTFR